MGCITLFLILAHVLSPLTGVLEYLWRKIEVLNKLLIVIAISLLTACASAPKDAPRYDEITIPEPSSEKSVLVFYRTFTPPACCNLDVSINDQEIISLPNNSFSYILLSPGTYKIEASAMGTGSKENFSIQPNTTMYMQINNSVFTPMGIEMGSSKNSTQSNMVAVNKLKECCQYVASQYSN